jgi:hypothetical protein
MHKAIVAGVVLIGVLVAEGAEAADPPKRPLPDYPGREPPPTTVGDVAIWVPRVVFSPIYFTTEYLIRRPIGAAEAAAEKANLPETLYDLFTFGPEHKVGWAPVAFVDFGLNPSVGVYGFWDDAIVKGDDLRAHFVGWPTAWVGGSAVQRIRTGGGHVLELRLEGIRRPDYPFYGLGPRSLQSAESRYGADSLGGRLATQFYFWRASKIEARLGVEYATFYDGHYGADPGVIEQAGKGAFALPPGFAGGYTAEYNFVGASLDSRRPFPHDGSGFRVAASAQQGSGFGSMPAGGWIRYEGDAGAFLDLDGHRRVVSLSFQTMFADPLGNAPIPFTELVTLGGFKAPMPGFLINRMIDRSGAVATLKYTWPIGPWLSGQLQTALGNVFGEHLDDFSTRLLRFSGAIGFQSDGSPDSNFEFLFGVGSETFEQGGKIDSFRLSLGTTTGL